MTSQRGLHCNLRRFQITNFPHHHHIGVLTQNSA
ncbi:Uncharacterised protein [Vibrio cholerae]|nr:Uncharacterised protein [Vibrio cholerae]CSI80821.1 Uncharacterised protein [Vibrio cholerae]